MALAVRELPKRAKPLMGHALPRLAPPLPARSKLAALRSTAASMGISLMPWQETAGRYLMAQGPDGRLLYREVCILAARQNGKTTIAKPYIVHGLRKGLKIIHIAQNRELPRIMFGLIADALSAEPELFPKRRGRVIWPRYGSGQEEIVLRNGGSYRIAAASRGGARGHPTDRLIIDELREMENFDVMAAAEPTLTMSEDPQTVYFSNEGTEDSVILNALRDRAGIDEALAFLSWSAAPEREPDDREGWAEANGALGHYPSVLRTLEKAYRSYRLAGKMSIFETEHLCRRVVTMAPSLVNDIAWSNGRRNDLEPPSLPAMAVNMDPNGTRASAVIAWQQSDGSIAYREVADVTGYPIDVDRLGTDLKTLALKLGAFEVGYAPWTDAALAKYFKRPKPIDGKAFANASGTFARLVDAGLIRWDVGDATSSDLVWTSRKDHESGAWAAAQSTEDHPVTAVLAGIRAVGMAAGPKPEGLKLY